MTAPEPTVACPVEGCKFTVKMKFAEISRAPFILDERPDLAFNEAVVRNAKAEGERVERILNEHGERDHDPDEFEAACLAVAAGLR